MSLSGPGVRGLRVCGCFVVDVGGKSLSYCVDTLSTPEGLSFSCLGLARSPFPLGSSRLSSPFFLRPFANLHGSGVGKKERGSSPDCTGLCTVMVGGNVVFIRVYEIRTGYPGYPPPQRTTGDPFEKKGLSSSTDPPLREGEVGL